MLRPDPAIDVAALARLLDSEYGETARPAAVEFVPAGGDSWCFRASAG